MKSNSKLCKGIQVRNEKWYLYMEISKNIIKNNHNSYFLNTIIIKYKNSRG